MSIFLITLTFTLGVIALCLIFLSIGTLVTGKPKWHIKRCGRPEKDGTCPHCAPKKDKDKNAK